MSAVWVLAGALAGAMTIFAIVWYVCLKIHNYGYLDAIWSLSLAAIAPYYAIMGTGDATRRTVFAAAGVFWSLRLGGYIAIRVTRHHPDEDKRYKTLREKWPSPGRFLLFFELQAVIAVVFSTPFWLASFDAQAPLSLLEIVGLLLAVGATLGEWIADVQAQRFKRSPTGPVLDVGLWHYSRHPNYFFESVVWWGFFIAALATPWGWVTIVCPLMMLYLLLNVTGIPLTEKHSLESRGDAYRRYQQTTNRFIPWFSKTPH